MILIILGALMGVPITILLLDPEHSLVGYILLLPTMLFSGAAVGYCIATLLPSLLNTLADCSRFTCP